MFWCLVPTATLSLTIYRGADKFLAQPTSRCIFFDSENISFDASLVTYNNNNNGYSALGPVWAGTRAQSGDWYGSDTLHPGQVLRSSLPLLSRDFRRSHFSRQVPPRPQ